MFIAGALVCLYALTSGIARAETEPNKPPVWEPPTPGETTELEAQVGVPLRIPLAASDPDGEDVVFIRALRLPPGGTLEHIDGNPARATLIFTATADEIGRLVVTIAAEDSAPSPLSITRTLVVSVVSRHGPRSLVGPGTLRRWAYVLVPTVARTAPSQDARIITRLATQTADDEPNLVLVLGEEADASGERWFHVQLAILPNGSTGWVPASGLDELHQVRTRLVVNRARLTATLFRSGRPVFRARIGVGHPSWPTPHGEFYVREKVAGFSDPFYGPVAFGLSARSNVLTDWPGGGFIGIHGTSMPWLLPGRVSHGCIRMRNADILGLARLLPLGTPVTIV